MNPCDLCREVGGDPVLRTDDLRVVLVDEAGYPGFVRVIWNAHVREVTDLTPAQIARLMSAVFGVERALRYVLNPLKVNVASLGNVTPHVHWHLIPRFADDPHFPQPIWGERQRQVSAAVLDARRALLPALTTEIRKRVGATT